MDWASQPVLFQTAAVLYGISVPAHLYMGFDITYPALRKIPKVGNDLIGKVGAEACWNYVAVALSISACLNWQWARTGGPQSTEETLIFWAIAGINAINGGRYLQVGSFGPLLPLWCAPLLSVVAFTSTKP